MAMLFSSVFHRFNSTEIHRKGFTFTNKSSTVSEGISVSSSIGHVMLVSNRCGGSSSTMAVSCRRADLSETNLHFLEEQDETILSKRILNLCQSNKVRSGLELFMSMCSTGLKPTPHACNSLVSSILRSSSLETALKVFDVMCKNNTATGHTYSMILKEVASKQGCDSALELFKSVELEAISNKSFDVITYNTMISVCIKAKNWIAAEGMWRKLKENGFHGTVITYSLLVSAFVQCGQSELALNAYREMIENKHKPGEDVLKAVVSSSTKEGNWMLALNILEQMLSVGIRPNLIVFNSIINCLGKASEPDRAFAVYDLLESAGHKPDSYTWKALLNSLYRSKRYTDCIHLFENIAKQERFEASEYLYSTVLMACQRLGWWNRSLQFLWKMEQDSKMDVSTAVYNLVLGSCEIARKPKVALQVYYHMIHQNCCPDTFTHLTLLRTCIWGSLWSDVEDILKHVVPDASLCNALIHGFCLSGKVELAEEMYQKMKSSGFEPDGKTRALMLQQITKNITSSAHHPRYDIRAANIKSSRRKAKVSSRRN